MVVTLEKLDTIGRDYQGLFTLAGGIVAVLTLMALARGRV